MHLTSSAIDWYAARAGGVVAYVLLSAVVVLGLSLAGKRRLGFWPRFAVEDVHRFGGLLVGTFVAVHVVTIAIDSYLPFSVPSIVVPFVSSYKPLWVALGIVAAELLVALAVANHYRNRLLSYKFWRRTHYLNFAVWTAATLHGLGSGTDRSSWWLVTITTVAVAAVTGATVLRVLQFRPPKRPGLVYAPFAAAALSAVLVLGLALGPLRSHPRPWNAANFDETLQGQILQDLGPTRGVVSVAANGVGDQPVLVRADLLIGPQQLLETTFQMEYLPSGLGCKGHVTHVENYGFRATCRTGQGAQRVVQARWESSASSQLVGGVISVHSA
jgi:methionine sulfoxide reductase heme-binding subunit